MQCWKLTLNISAPSWYVLSYLYVVQQGAHTYRHARSSRTCISPSSFLSLEERNWFRIFLTNCKPAHCFSLERTFPHAGRGIQKARGLQQADCTASCTTSAAAEPSEKRRLAIHLDCILHATSPHVFKGGHLQYCRLAWDEHHDRLCPFIHAVCYIGLIARKLSVIGLKTFHSRILDFGNYNVVKFNAHYCNCLQLRFRLLIGMWPGPLYLQVLGTDNPQPVHTRVERCQFAALKFDFVLVFSAVDI